MPELEKSLNSLLVKPAGPDCNMRCAYCFYSKKASLFDENKPRRMSEDVQEILIQQAMEQRKERICFGWQGGEPTLMGLGFYEKVVALQQRFQQGPAAANGLQTNGLVLDRRWARILSRDGFLVGLSMDGPEHVHDRYRFLADGQGSWSKVRDRALLLLDHGVELNALSVVTDYSARFPDEIYEFIKGLGLVHMQFIPCIEPDPQDPERPAAFSVSGKALGGFLCRLFDLWINDFVDGKPTTSIGLFDAVFHQYAGLAPPECSLLEECGIYVVVEHNGDVYSCDFFVEPDWKLGNIEQDRLSDLLNSRRQARFGKRKARLGRQCQQCPWLSYCRGGCPKERGYDRKDKSKNHLCQGYRMFFEHAHPRLKALAERWKLEQGLSGNGRSWAGPPGKPGRNDPCPCGSGRKYKKCCGR